MSSWPDEDDEELDDDESPDESDRDEEVNDTRPCPYCGKEIYEQAEVCPHCRSYISLEQVASRRPIWIWVTGVVLLAAMIYGAVRLLWF